MKQEIFQFTGYEATPLRAVLWLPDSEPKAVLQITHGMTEHIGRYRRLAEHLTAYGIVTAGFDLRGHGENPGDPHCASFGENGWKASLEDMRLFSAYLNQQFPGCPRFMLGFSLGSFLLREYMNHYGDKIAGAAVLGTGYQPSPVLSIMISIVKSQIAKAGFDSTTPLVKKLSFDTYNRQFAPSRTVSDWLCSDDMELDAYLADPLCRESISAGLFCSLLESMKRTGGKDAYDAWPKTVPVLLLSGRNDPVGSSGKGVPVVKKAMDRAGLKNVMIHLFEGARHDILHEEASGCADNARQILADWIINHTGSTVSETQISE